MRQPVPQEIILRATKTLAQVDWSGDHYQSVLTRPAELLDYLESRHISALVCDTYRPVISYPHQRLIDRAIRENPGRFQLAGSFRDRSSQLPGKVDIYLVRPAAVTERQRKLGKTSGSATE